MKYYHTFSFEKLARLCFVVFALVVCQANTGIAQCALSCNGSTQVSLNSQCSAVITPNLILSDNGAACPGPKTVEIVDVNGNVIDSLTSVHLGQTLNVSIIDINPEDGSGTGNSCWGVIIIEDKFGPSIMSGCMNDTINCVDLAVFPPPVFKDNCDGILEPVLLSENVVSCPSAVHSKVVTREYSARDNENNVASNNCTIQISVSYTHLTLPTIYSV